MTTGSTYFKIENYWKDEPRRRQFFERFAKRHGFDPLVPENWYKISRKEVAEGRGRTVLSYYSGNIVKALLDLFPNLDWDDTAFQSLPSMRFRFYLFVLIVIKNIIGGTTKICNDFLTCLPRETSLIP